MVLDKSFIYRDDWYDCECTPPKEDKHYFKLEPVLDPMDWNDAAELMRRRIQHAIDTCEDTDKYIIAAMAQNGPGFTRMDGSIPKLDKAKRPKGVVYDWEVYCKDAKLIDSSEQLQRFTRAIDGFKARNWSVPYINMTTVTHYS